MTVRDSAGVRIVEKPASAPPLDWLLGTEPVVEVGGCGLGEQYEL